MKKFIAILLVSLMALSVIPMFTSAAEAQEITLVMWNSNWENWNGSPNNPGGPYAEGTIGVTQLLICPELNGAKIEGIDNAEYTWKITLSDGTTSKTITASPQSFYNTTICRFEVCTYTGENQFVPVPGTNYTVDVEVYDGDTLLYYTEDPVAGYNCPADLVPQVPAAEGGDNGEDSGEDETPAANVAAGKPVLGGDGNSYPLVTDGTLDAYADIRWDLSDDNSGILNPNCWVEVDLGEAIVVGSVKVANYPWTDSYYQWEAYGSNDNTKPIEEWTKLCEKKDEKISGEAPEGYEYAVSDNDAYRYVRIVGTYHSKNYGYHFKEVEIYEKQNPAGGDSTAFIAAMAIVALFGTAVIVKKVND